MSQNDVIVLNANFATWEPRATGLTDIEPWLYYCVEQFVKAYTLSDEEIIYSITDGTLDGGADAIFFLVNHGVLVQEDTDLDPKGVSRVRIIFMQVKRGGGFKTTEIDKFYFLTDDFFDLSKDVSTFTQKYNPTILKIMRTFKEKYLHVIGGFPEVTIDYFYITGDDVTPHPNAIDSAGKVKAKALAHLSKATAQFHFISAAELWEQVQKRPAREKVLVWSETPMVAKEGYVGLVKLKDYFSFLQDDPGVLAERIFESNVRGFQADTPVNLRIRESLQAPGSANFWLLNNGITVLSSKVGSAGHLKLSLHDPQIVNGLQTSREVFSYFSEDKPSQEDRSILVRVIETQDAEVMDLVIRATNSQNRMQESSSRMTDPIHRKIEDLFKQYDLYYDRRKGFHKDQGVQIYKIVSATELAQAVISVVMQRPDDARARPGDYFKREERYKAVFGDEKFPLPVYLTCVRITRRVEEFLDKIGMERGDRRNLQFYVSSLVACELTEMVDPTPNRLLESGLPSAVTDKLINDCYTRVLKMYESLAEKSDRDTVARGPELTKRLRTLIKRRFGKGKSHSKSPGKKN